MGNVIKDNSMDAVSLIVEQDQLSDVSGSFEYLAGFDMISETLMPTENIYAYISGICNGVDGYQPAFAVSNDLSGGSISDISYFSWKGGSAFVVSVSGLTASSFKSGYGGYYYQNNQLVDAESKPPAQLVVLIWQPLQTVRSIPGKFTAKRLLPAAEIIGLRRKNPIVPRVYP